MMNDTIYFEIIAGSRAYRLNIDTSDVDLPQVSDHWKMHCIEDGYNIIRVPREEFVKRATLQYDKAYYLQWWFPDEWRSDNELARFMFSERERYISERRRRVYDVLFGQAEGLWTYSDWLYTGYPKRLAYSTLFYAIPARYAAGMTFAQAHRMDGELREQLLAMRRHEMSIEEAQMINRHWRERSMEANAFFDAPEDRAYTAGVEKKLRKLLNLEG